MPDIHDELKRLKNEKDELGSYNKLAKKYGVNVRYVWEYLTTGKVPSSRKVQRKLGIKTTALIYTRTRRQKLDRIARDMGHACWSAYESAMIREYDK